MNPRNQDNIIKKFKYFYGWVEKFYIEKRQNQLFMFNVSCYIDAQCSKILSKLLQFDKYCVINKKIPIYSKTKRYVL